MQLHQADPVLRTHILMQGTLADYSRKSGSIVRVVRSRKLSTLRVDVDFFEALSRSWSKNLVSLC